jgi:hypothetical protein
MSRHVFASLKEWRLKQRTDLCATDWERGAPDNAGGDEPQPVGMPREYPMEPCPPEVDPARAVEEQWKPRVISTKTEPMARCRVVAFEGDEAVCIVFMDGYEIPRVGFPARVLKAKGLDVGGRFIWTMRDSARVFASDIDTDVPQTDDMGAADKAELEEMYEKFQRRRTEDGGEWPEYVGPGQ